MQTRETGRGEGQPPPWPRRGLPTDRPRDDEWLELKHHSRRHAQLIDEAAEANQSACDKTPGVPDAT